MTKPVSDHSRQPHRRMNLLTGEWILVSPQRTQRPWQGETIQQPPSTLPAYDPACYLCPGNTRANGDINPPYTGTFAFTNDFPALAGGRPRVRSVRRGLLRARSESGECRVVNFSPRHDLTLAEMTRESIEGVIRTWQDEFRALASRRAVRYIQIFENKGRIMGNSNPHPHCQIWAQESVPNEPGKEHKQLVRYYARTRRSLLADYVKQELRESSRIVYTNDSFVVLVPWWAVWPFETLLVPRRKISTILQLSEREVSDFAAALQVITVRYDNLFTTSFPYSSGIHQAPTDAKRHPWWHMHMHFLPPLLRSAGIRKFMVGYEMLAEPQRDITPESAAETLRGLPDVHYKRRP